MSIISFPEKIKASIRSLNRRNRNIMIFIVYGLLFDIVQNTYKPFLVKFLQRLGGGEFHISLYNSLPAVVGLLSLIPGALFIARFKKKKNITTVFFVMSRLLILSLTIVPFIEKALAPFVFIFIIAVMNFPDALSQCSLQSFLGAAFDGRTRAEAISLRTKFGNIAVPVITLVTGFIIRFVPKNDEQTIMIYQIFFVTAFLISIFEIAVFRKFDEKINSESEPLPNEEKESVFQMLGNIFKDKKFGKFVSVMFVFHFTWHSGWPVFSAYQIIKLGANEMWLAFFAVISGIVTFITANWWSKWINKYGNDKILCVAGFCCAANMLTLYMAPNLPMYAVFSALSGFLSVAVSISLLNSLFEASKDKNRVVYIAVFNTVTNISLAISPFFSYLLLSNFSYPVIFLILGILRTLSALLIFKVYWPKKKIDTAKA